MSFGAIADDYNRLRPPPADGAVDWLVPPDCEVAVDLAAGTGLLSRALASRAGQVIAVEPDQRMAAVLRASSPGVRVLDGRGEAIPLPDGSADGLFISSAWHWMDHELAIREIGRVLRDGGRFGMIWTSRDRQVDWVAELDGIGDQDRSRQPDGDARQEAGSAGAAGTAGYARPGGDQDPARQPRGDTDQAEGSGPEQHGRRDRRWQRDIVLPPTDLFGPAETAEFAFTRPMLLDDVVRMLGTYSNVITADPAERAAGLSRAASALRERFPGAGEIAVPMRSRCWRADRAARS